MDDWLSVERVAADPVTSRHTEFVERKGVGHPDSLCDGVAEAVSRRLSRYYREEFGRVLHHNTDKVHLSAGRADPDYGGGRVVDPIYVLLGGRATSAVNGTELPVDDLAIDAAREYLLSVAPELDAGDVEIESRLGPSSTDLRDLFDRDATPRANDTSFGVGYAPLSPTERLVRTLEPHVHGELDAVGPDVKVMAARRGEALDLTVAAAVVDRHVEDLAAYRDVCDAVRALAERHAREHVDGPVSVTVNAGDDPGSGSVYLTTTGLSAEMGDDGGVGRGNRANGLITPTRPMSLEAVSGKNPVSHVGKLYNLLATRVAGRLHDERGADYAGVQVLAHIGAPVDDPAAADVTTTLDDRDAVAAVLREELDDLPGLTDRLVRGEVATF